VIRDRAIVRARINNLFDHLLSKFSVDLSSCIVELYVYETEYFEEGDSVYYSQYQEELPCINFLIAAHADHDPLVLFAHEFCHLLQSLVWKTWPVGIKHPPQDHPLEEEARCFAEEESKAYALIVGPSSYFP